MMRVELSPTGKFEINLGDGVTHVLSREKALRLAAWIEELADDGIVGKVFFVEAPGFEGYATVLGVNNDDTVRVKSSYTGEIYIVSKDDLVESIVNDPLVKSEAG